MIPEFRRVLVGKGFVGLREKEEREGWIKVSREMKDELIWVRSIKEKGKGKGKKGERSMSSKCCRRGQRVVVCNVCIIHGTTCFISNIFLQFPVSASYIFPIKFLKSFLQNFGECMIMAYISSFTTQFFSNLFIQVFTST